MKNLGFSKKQSEGRTSLLSGADEDGIGHYEGKSKRKSSKLKKKGRDNADDYNDTEDFPIEPRASQLGKNGDEVDIFADSTSSKDDFIWNDDAAFPTPSADNEEVDWDETAFQDDWPVSSNNIEEADDASDSEEDATETDDDNDDHSADSDDKAGTMLVDFPSPNSKGSQKNGKMLVDFPSSKNIKKDGEMLVDFPSSKNIKKEVGMLVDFPSHRLKSEESDSEASECESESEQILEGMEDVAFEASFSQIGLKAQKSKSEKKGIKKLFKKKKDTSNYADSNAKKSAEIVVDKSKLPGANVIHDSTDPGDEQHEQDIEKSGGKDRFKKLKKTLKKSAKLVKGKGSSKEALESDSEDENEAATEIANENSSGDNLDDDDELNGQDMSQKSHDIAKAANRNIRHRPVRRRRATMTEESARMHARSLEQQGPPESKDHWRRPRRNTAGKLPRENSDNQRPNERDESEKRQPARRSRTSRDGETKSEAEPQPRRSRTSDNISSRAVPSSSSSRNHNKRGSVRLEMVDSSSRNVPSQTINQQRKHSKRASLCSVPAERGGREMSDSCRQNEQIDESQNRKYGSESRQHRLPRRSMSNDDSIPTHNGYRRTRTETSMMARRAQSTRHLVGGAKMTDVSDVGLTSRQRLMRASMSQRHLAKHEHKEDKPMALGNLFGGSKSGDTRLMTISADNQHRRKGSDAVVIKTEEDGDDESYKSEETDVSETSEDEVKTRKEKSAAAIVESALSSESLTIKDVEKLIKAVAYQARDAKDADDLESIVINALQNREKSTQAHFEVERAPELQLKSVEKSLVDSTTSFDDSMELSSSSNMDASDGSKMTKKMIHDTTRNVVQNFLNKREAMSRISQMREDEPLMHEKKSSKSTLDFAEVASKLEAKAAAKAAVKAKLANSTTAYLSPGKTSNSKEEFRSSQGLVNPPSAAVGDDVVGKAQASELDASRKSDSRLSVSERLPVTQNHTASGRTLGGDSQVGCRYKAKEAMDMSQRHSVRSRPSASNGVPNFSEVAARLQKKAEEKNRARLRAQMTAAK